LHVSFSDLVSAETYGISLPSQVPLDIAIDTEDRTNLPGSTPRKPIDSHFIADAAKAASPSVVTLQSEGRLFLGGEDLTYLLYKKCPSALLRVLRRDQDSSSTRKASLSRMRML